ncbi:MAG TPA: sporulation protein YqfD [Candidatus Eisenbergiella merdipullorum]|uniref:Sporulation protein YqfD n=1 Tax=Candidatus Eisenbergiella merdipullorum TaxID=2838553 RepID=A0A9D2I5Y0_9FIRM|nr:sporulation protein YqfD [Candidatus Eisenbergiella merdipullorum]
MKNFFRYLQGYLKIRVWGYSPERFMNLCSNRGILLWDITRREEDYLMYISLSGFFRLRPVVRKTGTRVLVLERCGLPFLLRRMQKRKVFVMGFPACLAFLLIMSRFIWAIDLEGNRAVTDDMLMDFLAENGVEYGTARNRIDMEQLEENLRETFDEITWASVTIDGTRLTVNIRENDLVMTEEEKEEVLEEYPASDLLATQDGTVISILTRQGVPQVTAGMEVKKGDILVSGAVPVFADDGSIKEYQFCHADADVVIAYELSFEEELALNYEYKNYTGREKKDFFLSFGGRRFVFRLGGCRFLKYDTVTDARQLKVLGQIYLPFFYGFEVKREYFEVEAVYQKEKAEEILEERLEKKIEGLYDLGVQIKQKNVTINTVDGLAVLNAAFDVEGKTGQPRPLSEQQPALEGET